MIIVFWLRIVGLRTIHWHKLFFKITFHTLIIILHSVRLQQIQHGDISALGDGIQVATVTTDSGEVLQIQQALASSVTE